MGTPTHEGSEPVPVTDPQPAPEAMLIAERPSHLAWCVTHVEMAKGDCCRFAKCGHVPRCDVRRLLIEASGD